MVHDHDARADLLDFFHVMAGIDDGCTFCVQAQDSLEDGIAALGIDGDGRLVQEDELGFVRDAAGDVQSAQQAARKLLRTEFLEFLKSDERDGIVDHSASLRTVGNVERAERIDVFTYGEFVEYGHVLRNDADATLRFVVRRVHAGAEQIDLAMVVAQQLQDAVDRRGFP